MSYELLSEPIRKYIRDKRWESLRPIQAAAINKILSTSANYILASKTASGKTEAAFLPVLSKVDFNERGAQVLYISPLIALINDQFIRIEELCNYLDVRVTKWHGEANKTQKEKLLKDPTGVVLITPESLEAMFVNAPYNVKNIFSNLKFVVIDEIHSFIGTDRGVQLKSLLSRLLQINKNKVTFIGLSATIGDYDEAKKMTGDENNTKVLLDRASKEMEIHFRYFGSDTTELPLILLKELYKETKDNKVLIFPNSRGRAEEIAVKLKKISEKAKGHPYYFSHHSSVDKELREYIEHFAKNNQRHNFCIVCTSTLELGIDIGTVDEVVQVDATYSIASLIQRVGRSGRRGEEKSVLFLYATNKWSFLQSLACLLLYQEGFIEPVLTSEKPYDILLHQILSIIKQTNGCKRSEIIERIKINFAFNKISQEEVEAILDHLIELDFVEVIHHDLIIGVEGEHIVNSRDFYSVFKTEPNLKVIHAGKSIGEVPFSPQLIPDENILLAARMWKIRDVDVKSNKVEVVPANDGKKPVFFGTGGSIHPRVRKRMLQIIMDSTEYPALDEAAKEVLRELRAEFSIFPIENFSDDRPIIYKEEECLLYTFQGTKINRSLNYLVTKCNLTCFYDEQSSSFEILVKQSEIKKVLNQLQETIYEIDLLLENTLNTNPAILDFSKWGKYLPIKHQVNILKVKYFDFEGTKEFLQNINIKTPAY